MSAARSARRRLVARFVVASADHVLAPGVVEWDPAGRVVALRRARRSERAADVAVVPGLVNAHVHLQLAKLPRAVRRFLPWVRAVMRERASCSPAELRRTARRGAEALLASGTTSIGEIDSTGLTPAALRGLGIGGRVYRELTGYHLDAAGARRLLRSLRNGGGVGVDRGGGGVGGGVGGGGRAGGGGARDRVRGRDVDDDGGGRRMDDGRDRLACGWSPHAPYSVSADLFRAAARASTRLTVHCAELPEEQEFLRTGRGPFRELLERLGRLPDAHRAPGCGAVRWLERLGLLRAGTLLVHCQELERGDAARIAVAGASVVVCPGTIDYFRRTPPPVPDWLARGIPVALGTDSLASNTGLDLRRELARAAQMWPVLSPLELLRMATEHGGAGLAVPAGGLRRGRWADLLVVAAGRTVDDTIAGFVHGETPLRQVVLRGRRIHRGTGS